MPPEGRFTTPTTQNAVFSDDFNDEMITSGACVREALIEVNLISASLDYFRHFFALECSGKAQTRSLVFVFWDRMRKYTPSEEPPGKPQLCLGCPKIFVRPHAIYAFLWEEKFRRVAAYRGHCGQAPEGWFGPVWGDILPLEKWSGASYIMAHAGYVEHKDTLNKTRGQQ